MSAPSGSLDHGKTIVDLPPELLERVVQFTEPLALANMRLTCKTFCTLASRSFGEKQLANRRFMFSEESLQGLCELTAHPVFGRCVQSISFGTNRLHTDVQSIAQSILCESIFYDIDVQEEEKQYIAASSEQHRITASFHYHYLLQSFKNLRFYGRGNSKVTVGVFDDLLEIDDNKCFRTSYGSERLYGELTIHYWDRCLFETLNILIDSMEGANFIPFGLDLDLRECSNQSLSSFCEMEKLRIALDPFVRQILSQSHQMDFRIASPQVEVKLQMSRRSLKFCLAATSKPIYLNLYELGRRSRAPSKIWDGPFHQVIRSPFLLHITLNSVSIKATELVELLTWHESTLQTLELKHVLLMMTKSSNEDVPLVLDRISTLENICYVEIFRIGYTEFYHGTGHDENMLILEETWYDKDEIECGMSRVLLEFERCHNDHAWENHELYSDIFEVEWDEDLNEEEEAFRARSEVWRMWGDKK